MQGCEEEYEGFVEELEIDDFQIIDIGGDRQSNKRRSKWRWLKIGGLVVVCVAAGVAFSIWVLLLDKVVIPFLIWVASRFSRSQLALVLIASLCIFPVILIPSGPSMWLAGIIFGYGVGFLIIMAGTTIGQSLPYFVGHYLFHQRIQEWLERWPRKAIVLRAAEAGGWFEKFRTVMLLRVSPIPYTLFNYAIAATKIEFWPYICGSVAGMIPEAFITIYSGRLLKSLADAKHEKRHMNTVEIVYNIVGFIVAVGVAVSLTIYGKKAMLEMEIKGANETGTTHEVHSPNISELRRLGS